MRWQTVARAVVAIAGVGTAVAIYLSSRNRPAPFYRQPMATVADPKANVQSGRGTDVRYQDSDEQSTIEYAASKQFDGGRSVYDGVKMTLKKDGTVIVAGHLECQSQGGDRPSSCAMSHGVEFTSNDNTKIAGDSGTYVESPGTATIPGPVKFTRGRMSGTGTGGTYDRQSGVFRLLADVHITAAADANGGGQIDGTGQTMTFSSHDRSLLLDQNAHLVRDGDTLTAGNATLFLADDEQYFKAIQMRGQSRVAPAPTHAASTGLPEMSADDIDLGFYPNSQSLQQAFLNRSAHMVMADAQGKRSIDSPQINFQTAPDGSTVTRLEASGGRVKVVTPASPTEPERLIGAATLVATGDAQHGLTAAVFDGGAEFHETIAAANGHPASKRTGTSRSITMAIKGQLDAIDKAEFRQDVRFSDEDVAGDADVGIYQAAAGQLELRPAPQGPKRLPHVKTDSVTVDASQSIAIDLNTNNLVALRDVKTVSKGNQGPSNAASLFDGSDPVYGSAAEFHYVDADKKATYIGTADAVARVWQTETESTVSAVTVTLNQTTQDLSASGGVDSTYVLTSDAPPTAGKPQALAKYHATGDSLVYVDASRTATYVGGPASLTSPDGKTEGRQLVLTLAEASRSLDRLDATGTPGPTEVHSVLQAGREAHGTSLVYEAPADRYTLKGQPLTLLTRDADGTCSVATGTFARFIGAIGAPEFPTAENPGNSVSKAKQPCTGSLRP